jgi:hypothetical protein
MRTTIARRLVPLSIAGLSAVSITGCGGSSRPPARLVPGAKLASAVFALSAAQNLTEVSEYVNGRFIGHTLIDASRHLDTEVGPAGTTPPAIRIHNSIFVLLPGGLGATGASCYVERSLPWSRLRRFALSPGATVTAVKGHTIDFKTANAHGAFEFSAANLIIGEQATVHSAPAPSHPVNYSWTYSYPASPPAGLVTRAPKNLCS